jgi:hypothetical protein
MSDGIQSNIAHVFPHLAPTEPPMVPHGLKAGFGAALPDEGGDCLPFREWRVYLIGTIS